MHSERLWGRHVSFNYLRKVVFEHFISVVGCLRIERKAAALVRGDIGSKLAVCAVAIAITDDRLYRNIHTEVVRITLIETVRERLVSFLNLGLVCQSSYHNDQH